MRTIRFKKITLAILSISVFNGQAMAANEPLSLDPDGQWNIDYANDSCTLGRKFSTGEKHITMYITRFEPEDKFELILVGNIIKKPKSLALLTVQFGEHEDEQVNSYYVSKTKDGSNVLIMASSLTISAETDAFAQKKKDEKPPEIKPITIEREKDVKYISFYEDKGDIIKLQTGDMGGPFKALRACTDELISHWGINAELHKNKLQGVTPRNDPANWVTPNDYPRNALLANENAIIKFRLKINKSGKVEECHIQQSIGSESFGKVVCDKVTRRARFNPALDKDGNPMASYFIDKVRFQIPQ